MEQVRYTYFNPATNSWYYTDWYDVGAIQNVPKGWVEYERRDISSPEKYNVINKLPEQQIQQQIQQQYPQSQYPNLYQTTTTYEVKIGDQSYSFSNKEAAEQFAREEQEKLEKLQNLKQIEIPDFLKSRLSPEMIFTASWLKQYGSPPPSNTYNVYNKLQAQITPTQTREVYYKWSGSEPTQEEIRQIELQTGGKYAGLKSTSEGTVISVSVPSGAPQIQKLQITNQPPKEQIEQAKQQITQEKAQEIKEEVIGGALTSIPELNLPYQTYLIYKAITQPKPSEAKIAAAKEMAEERIREMSQPEKYLYLVGAAPSNYAYEAAGTFILGSKKNVDDIIKNALMTSYLRPIYSYTSFAQEAVGSVELGAISGILSPSISNALQGISVIQSHPLLFTTSVLAATTAASYTLSPPRNTEELVGRVVGDIAKMGLFTAGFSLTYQPQTQYREILGRYREEKTIAGGGEVGREKVELEGVSGEATKINIKKMGKFYDATIYKIQEEPTGKTAEFLKAQFKPSTDIEKGEELYNAISGKLIKTLPSGLELRESGGYLYVISKEPTGLATQKITKEDIVDMLRIGKEFLAGKQAETPEGIAYWLKQKSQTWELPITQQPTEKPEPIRILQGGGTKTPWEKTFSNIPNILENVEGTPIENVQQFVKNVENIRFAPEYYSPISLTYQMPILTQEIVFIPTPTTTAERYEPTTSQALTLPILKYEPVEVTTQNKIIEGITPTYRPIEATVLKNINEITQTYTPIETTTYKPIEAITTKYSPVEAIKQVESTETILTLTPTTAAITPPPPPTLPNLNFNIPYFDIGMGVKSANYGLKIISRKLKEASQLW